MDHLIEEVKKIPIKDVIETRIEVVGNNALCPFHNDSNMGSFKISDSKGIFKCFSCGESGDSISFISKFDHITYKEAAYKIAYEFGMISEKEYLGKKFTGKITVPKNIVEKQYSLAELADDDIIDLVYRAISKNGLSEEHLNYLLNDRHLSKEQIELGEYFTMPNEREVFKLIKSSLKNAGLVKGDLIGVPGFYRSNGKIRFKSYKGVGIPIKNINGEILGLQVRRDRENPRYLWVASTFANGKDGNFDGCSSGAPIATVIPENVKAKTILITEGHFKACVFADTYRMPALAVQGVNSVDGLDYAIREIKHKFGSTNILLGFDADMIHNYEVYKASKKIVEKLSKLDMNIAYLLWDEKDGKGLDDLIINKKNNTLRAIRYEKFIKHYERVLSNLKKDFSDKELEESIRKEFFKG